MSELKKPRWKKKPNTGAHFMKTPNGRVEVKEGEVIEALPSELGSGLDKFIQLDTVPDHQGDPQPKQEQVEATLKAVHKGAGKYAVIDKNGRQLNDELLSKKEAESFINGIPAEADETEADDHATVEGAEDLA